MTQKKVWQHNRDNAAALETDSESWLDRCSDRHVQQDEAATAERQGSGEELSK